MAITDTLKARVVARQNAQLVFLGDSLTEGAYATTPGGWVYHAMNELAEEYDYNWTLRAVGSGSPGYPTSGLGYTEFNDVSSEGPTAPRFECLQRGVGGSTAQFIASFAGTFIPGFYTSDTPHLTNVAWGMNDFGLVATGYSPESVASYLTSINAAIRTVKGSGTPILMDTESPADGGDSRQSQYNPTLRPADFQGMFSYLTNSFVGASMPFSAANPIISSPSNANLAFIDSWLAFNHTYQTIMTVDDVHLSELGYQTKGVWWARQLINQMDIGGGGPGPVGPPGEFSTIGRPKIKLDGQFYDMTIKSKVGDRFRKVIVRMPATFTPE